MLVLSYLPVELSHCSGESITCDPNIIPRYFALLTTESLIPERTNCGSLSSSVRTIQHFLTFHSALCILAQFEQISRGFCALAGFDRSMITAVSSENSRDGCGRLTSWNSRVLSSFWSVSVNKSHRAGLSPPP